MEFPKAGSGPNRKQIIDALRNTAQSASNMVAENASMPVDALAWALRKMGVPVGDKPVMGSDWMREKGLTAPTQEGASKVVGDTIGMISPMGFTKQGAQAIVEGAGKLKGLPVGMSIKDVSGPQSQALLLAQQRAALPVEQGGLGLPANNTAAERAAAMGFKDEGLLHGTTNDFPAFEKSTRHSVYATDKPEIADIYANAVGRQKAMRVINAEPNVIPLMSRGKRLELTDFRDGSGGWSKDNLESALGASVPNRGSWKALPEHGYDSAKVLMDDLGGRQHQYIFPDADVLRSRFAAFDPFRKTAATAALMGVAAPDLLAQERDNGNR
jgi:hypothetical protein